MLKQIMTLSFLLIVAFPTLSREKFKDGDEPEYSQSSSSSFGSGLALEPTHYMYVPTPAVLDEEQFILSFHEWSLGIDRNLQVFISPFSSIGGIFLGGKYGLSSTTAVCAGLASGWYWGRRYVVEVDPQGRLYYPAPGNGGVGLGAFAAKSLSRRGALTGNLRIWNGYLRMGIGYGGSSPIGQLTKLLYEVQAGFGTGNLVGGEDASVEGGVGLRYTVRKMPPLKITVGIGLEQRFLYRSGFVPWPYIDVSYGSSF